MKTGIELIAFERDRQRSAEGYDDEHDDGHDTMEIASAAACYLDHYIYGCDPADALYCARWPWNQESWKPVVGEGASFKLANLAKAGALIAAEMDRLLRTLTADPCTRCAAKGWDTETNGPCPKFPKCEESFPQNREL
jgi:hypothetical protein